MERREGFGSERRDGDGGRRGGGADEQAIGDVDNRGPDAVADGAAIDGLEEHVGAKCDARRRRMEPKAGAARK